MNFDDVKFNGFYGGVERWILGREITLPTATTAEGLSKSGNITIDAIGVGATTVTVTNSDFGEADLVINGNIDSTASIRGDAIISRNTVKIGGGTAFVFDVTGTPTADRTITIPDQSGTVALLNRAQNFTAEQQVFRANFFVFNGFGPVMSVYADAGGLAQFGVFGNHVNQQAATTAVPATPALAGVGTVDVTVLTNQLDAMRTTIEELRARLTAYGFTP